MKLLYLFSTLAIMFLIGVGLILATYPRTKNATLSILIGFLVIPVVLFWIEHYVGLGNIYVFMPVAVGLSAFVVYKRRRFISEIKDSLLIFLFFFLFVLFWRYLMPDMNPYTSENLTNLAFLNSMRYGETLPPTDVWYSGYKQDDYYIFLHYCSALIGRLLGLTPGYNYHLAFCTVVALTASVAWGFLKILAPNSKFVLRFLVVTSFVLGGTGVAPFTTLLYKSSESWPVSEDLQIVRIWSNVRFSGSMDKRINDEGVRNYLNVDEEKSIESPIETLGFFVFTADLHASLTSYLFIASLFFLGFFAIRKKPEKMEEDDEKAKLFSAALLGFLCVVPLAANAWVFPLLLLGSLVLMISKMEKKSWIVFLLGGIVGVFFLQPYLSYFVKSSAAFKISLASAENIVPFKKVLVQQWPMWLLIGFSLFFYKSNKILFKIGLYCLFLGCVVHYFVLSPNDYPDRFNTALKWGSWVYSTSILVLGGALLLERRNSKTIKIFTFLTLVLVSSFLIDFFKFFKVYEAPNKGKLTADGFLENNDARNNIYLYLKNRPKGIVLEPQNGLQAYSPISSIALLTENISFLGWGAHKNIWRKNDSNLFLRSEKIKSFFNGDMKDAIDWLEINDIKYIVLPSWSKGIEEDKWSEINSQIEERYTWVGFSLSEKIGVWERK